jgi:hypothetical protein
MSVSPFLYLIAFGYAMGNEVAIEDHTYMEFLIPGLVAMASMILAFAIATDINISRFLLAYLRGVPGSAHQQSVLCRGGSPGRHCPCGHLGCSHYPIRPFIWGCASVQQPPVLDGRFFEQLRVCITRGGNCHAGQVTCGSVHADQFRDHPHGLSRRYLFPGGPSPCLGTEDSQFSSPDPCVTYDSFRILW